MEKHVVNTTSLFAVDDSFEDSRFMKVRIAAMHSGINRNGSNFKKEVIESAKDTFANIPILAEVVEKTNEDGTKFLDYTTHAMHTEQDYYNEDELRVIYDEVPVGLIPENNNFELVYDEENDNYVVMCDGMIYRDYGNYAADILKERNGLTDVSAEIACDELSYSADDKCLNVGKMVMCAVTLLGADTKPGMKGAHAQMSFSSTEEDRQDKLIRIMQELKESLDNYNKNFGKEELKEVVNENVILNETAEAEEVVEEVTSTEEAAEEVTVEEEVSTEPTEVTLEENDDTEDEEPQGEDVVVEEPADDVVDEVVEETAEPVVELNEEQDIHNFTKTLKYGETVKEFSISLSEKMMALWNLVNETYAELDNDCYDVEVFEDEKYVEMYSWYGNKCYRQQFKCKKKCEYSLVGDRVEIFRRFLTQDEITALESMQGKFNEIETKLNNYEQEPEKMNILNSSEYSQISNSDEMLSLKEMNNHFNLSVDEVRQKADEILLTYAKSGNLSFASVEPTAEVSKKMLSFNTKKKEGRYGKLFANMNK